MASAETIAAAQEQPFSAPRGLLAFLTDPVSEATLRAAIGGELPLGCERGNVDTAARALARRAAPAFLLVDLSGAIDPAASLDRLAQVCAPGVTAIAVGQRTDSGFYRTMTRQCGVAEYLTLPLTREAVLRHLVPLLRGTAAPSSAPGGRVVAVCGARGGVGATTVATSLALQVAAGSRGHVAFLDLDLQRGAAATLLGLTPGAGLRRALEEPQGIDELFIERVAVPVADRLRLIAAEEDLAATPAPTEAGLLGLLGLLRRRFNTVIVDAPRLTGPHVAALLAAADLRLLVLAPDIGSLREAVRLRALFASLAGREDALHVLNHAGLPGALTLAAVTEGLGRTPEAVLPHLPKTLVAAANLGVPAVAHERRFAAAMAVVAREVAGVGTRPSRGWLARVLGR